MTILNHRLGGRRELFILALMLEFLHFSIWIDFGSLASRSLMLIHLGLFLIWQPVWRSDEKISWPNSLAFFLFTIAIATFLDWRVMFGWLILLIGFAGGRILINRQERNIYTLVLLFLTLELIIACTTNLFNISLSNNVRVSVNIRDIFSIALPLFPIVIASLPISREDNILRSVDILHALSTSTLIGILIFGTLLNMYLSGTEYLIAMVQTLTGITIFLFIISWMLAPRSGFSGLSQLWSSSLLNIGTPFEKWLTNLSNLSLQRQNPDDFLEAAMEDLMAMAWIIGLKWQSEEIEGELGNTSRHETEFNTSNFKLKIYSNNWLGGALYLHCTLLIRLIDNFYLGKIRERKLTQQTHLQAVHETGARVTHDIKNLLQSLHAITSIIQYDHGAPESKTVSQKLLEKQLPHLTQRLQLALDKLQAPDKETMDEVYIEDWWDDLIKRNVLMNIEFNSDISDNRIIPADLFDGMVENMLENLREKSRLNRDLKITISLNCKTDNISLIISDNGKKIPDGIARDLLKEPVKSNSGLGIGLYQIARLAEITGYELNLIENRDGNIRFELKNRPGAETRLMSG